MTIFLNFIVMISALGTIVFSGVLAYVAICDPPDRDDRNWETHAAVVGIAVLILPCALRQLGLI
jgi:hypothetical protein